MDIDSSRTIRRVILAQRLLRADSRKLKVIQYSADPNTRIRATKREREEERERKKNGIEKQERKYIYNGINRID